MDDLLKLPFDDDEEAALVKYLKESTEPNSQELLVMHYLQRGRYVEAIRANQHLNQHSIMVSSKYSVHNMVLNIDFHYVRKCV